MSGRSRVDASHIVTHDGQAPVALSLEVGRLFEAFPEASFVVGAADVSAPARTPATRRQIEREEA